MTAGTDERRTDQRDLALQLHVTATYSWAGNLPPDLRHYTLKDRLDGFIHSFIVTLEGDGGSEPHRLSPKTNPALDLMDLPDVSLRYPVQDGGDRTGLPAEAEEFVAGILEVRDLILNGEWTGNLDPVIAFAEAVCQFIEHRYLLVPLTCDEDSGEVCREREDIAPGLAEAYRQQAAR